MPTHQIMVVDGPAQGRSISISPGAIVVGRDADAGLAVQDDQELSRRHALIRRDGHAVTISDLGSTNGTRINGIAVRGSHQLRAGDLIQIGLSTLRYDADADADVGSGNRSVVEQSGRVHNGTLIQAGRDAVHAGFHIGRFGTGGIVAGVALVLVLAIVVAVVLLNRVSLPEVTGRWAHEGGEVGGITTDRSVLTIEGDGTFRLQSAHRIGATGRAFRVDCRGDVDPGFGRFTFRGSDGMCSDFTGTLVRDGEGLEISGNAEQSTMTLTRTR